MRLAKIILFCCLWSFVALVEIYDIYLSIKFQDYLIHMEENPIGRMLIRIDDGDIALFMTLKIVGLVLLLTVLPILYSLKRTKVAWTFLGMMFISRLLLLIYLQSSPWYY